MWQCINEERGKMSFMRMKPSLHSYLDNMCLACNLENNNKCLKLCIDMEVFHYSFKCFLDDVSL
jgi:hypothetical protein